MLMLLLLLLLLLLRLLLWLFLPCNYHPHWRMLLERSLRTVRRRQEKQWLSYHQYFASGLLQQ
jgi:hypothetical protein